MNQKEFVMAYVLARIGSGSVNTIPDIPKIIDYGIKAYYLINKLN